MARSTSVIALAGAGILVVAVGAAALRGTDDGIPQDSATTEPTDAATDVASPTPTGTRSPTVTATDAADPVPPDQDGHGDDAATEPSDATTEDATADTDTDTDTVAMGETERADVDDTPRTGGGGLAMLGGAVAAGAVMAGRRPRG